MCTQQDQTKSNFRMIKRQNVVHITTSRSKEHLPTITQAQLAKKCFADYLFKKSFLYRKRAHVCRMRYMAKTVFTGGGKCCACGMEEHYEKRAGSIPNAGRILFLDLLDISAGKE